MLQALYVLLIPRKIFKAHYKVSLKDDKTEVWRGQVSCPMSPNKLVVELGFDSREFSSRF